jgi:uncharacterized protein (TIGR02677 family)
MDEKLLKPISEATYLTTENAWRYRAILRYFYRQHERLRHYLFPEEVYQFLKQSPYFQDYTEEQLQYDLNQLVEWKNLIPRQETGKVSTIEEFKKKRFRYQCTPYTVEIERMVQGLEGMGDSFGGSLERTLFDRLLQSLVRLTSQQSSGENASELTDEELNGLWEEMYEQFRKLTENATDYLAHLKSDKVEEVMRTEAFLAYKGAITEYLRNFMMALQRTSLKIETILEKTPRELLEKLIGRIADYQLTIPRLNEQPGREELRIKYWDQWQGLKQWFLGLEGRESELVFLQNETNETIRRMTRFAQRLGERHHNFRSRRKDYLYLAQWFCSMEELWEAHELSACVFGVFHTRHIFAGKKETEDIYAEVWDQPPTVLTIKPRVRQYREKTKPGALESRQEEKEELLKQYLLEREAEQKLIQRLIQQNRIAVKDLPVVDPYIRKTLLNWIGKCMGQPNRTAKTETGRRVRLSLLDSTKITLNSEDGLLQMPNFVFTFLD